MTGIIRAERVAFRYLSMITACGPPRLEARWADRYLLLACGLWQKHIGSLPEPSRLALLATTPNRA